MSPAGWAAVQRAGYPKAPAGLSQSLGKRVGPLHLRRPHESEASAAGDESACAVTALAAALDLIRQALPSGDTPNPARPPQTQEAVRSAQRGGHILLVEAAVSQASST